MATETLEVKIPEVDSLLKEEFGVSDSDKKESPVTDDTETTDEEKDEDLEEKSEENEEKTTPEKELATPSSDRPTRERKRTARYILDTPSRSSGSKTVSIEQGRGKRLKDIPNVAYKLSKRKPDDNLFLLHTILFGKKGKAQMLKRNIGQFSGFVWSEHEEEKQRAKAKDKLDKCIKEKLIDLCDVLDIPINKSNVKKEELAVRVLEFLENPKATRDIVLADSENKTKKRKKSSPKSTTSGGESSDVPAKRRRQTEESKKKQDQTSETEEANGEGDVGTNDAAEEKENKDTETKEEKDKSEEKTSTDKKISSKRTKKEKPASEEEKSLKVSAKSSRKSSKQVVKSTSSSSKKQKVGKEDSSKEKGKKKIQTKGSKDQGKASKRGKTEPTRKEMQKVVAKILKEVDFNTATLCDILQQLGSHFGVDLMHRKTEVKDIITDAIDNMSDDDENTEDEAEKEKKDKAKKK